jgi:hypothetical protein
MPSPSSLVGQLEALHYCEEALRIFGAELDFCHVFPSREVRVRLIIYQIQ